MRVLPFHPLDQFSQLRVDDAAQVPVLAAFGVQSVQPVFAVAARPFQGDRRNRSPLRKLDVITQRVQGRKSLRVMPDSPPVKARVRSDSRDFAILGSSWRHGVVLWSE